MAEVEPTPEDRSVSLFPDRPGLKERAVHAPVELIEIHGIDAIAELLVFAQDPPDPFLVLTPLISVARMGRLPHPFQHFVIELGPTKQFGELRLAIRTLGSELGQHRLFGRQRAQFLSTADDRLVRQ